MRELTIKRIVWLLRYVSDLEGLLQVVQQYAAAEMNKTR